MTLETRGLIFVDIYDVHDNDCVSKFTKSFLPWKLEWFHLILLFREKVRQFKLRAISSTDHFRQTVPKIPLRRAIHHCQY